jgi:hypothetical protein
MFLHSQHYSVWQSEDKLCCRQFWLRRFWIWCQRAVRVARAGRSNIGRYLIIVQWLLLMLLWTSFYHKKNFFFWPREPWKRYTTFVKNCPKFWRTPNVMGIFKWALFWTFSGSGSPNLSPVLLQKNLIHPLCNWRALVVCNCTHLARGKSEEKTLRTLTRHGTTIYCGFGTIQYQAT